MQNSFSPYQTFSGQDIQVVVFDTMRLSESVPQTNRTAASDHAAKRKREDYTDFVSEASSYYSDQSEQIERDLDHLGFHDKDAVSNAKRTAHRKVLVESYEESGNEDLAGGLLSTLQGGSRGREPSIFFPIGNLDTFSYSTFREKVAVRSLGRSQSLGYTRGARTVAGSMVFNVLQEDALLEFFQRGRSQKDAPMMLDQIRPFNVVLFFCNEYGGQSILHLYNVEIASESQRMSINDIVIQNTVNFYATDVIPIQNEGNMFVNPMDMHLRSSYPAELIDALAKDYGRSKDKVDGLLNINKKGNRMNDLLLRSRR